MAPALTVLVSISLQLPTVLVLFLIITVEKKTFSSTFLGFSARTLKLKLTKDQLTERKVVSLPNGSHHRNELKK